MIYKNQTLGISVVLGYVLLLIVTAVGISTLLVGFQGVITNTSNTVEEDEARMSSIQMVSYITAIDSNIANTTTTTYSFTPPSDSVVTKTNIKYEIKDTPEPNIYVLQTSKVSSNEVYTQKFKLEHTSFKTDTVGNSTNIRLEYDSSTNSIYFG